MSDRPEDRRRHRRVTAQLPVVIPEIDSAEASTQDVSESGMGIVVSQKIETGNTLEVLLDVPRERTGSIKTMATVMWSAQTDSGAYIAGLKFEGPSPEAMERLRSFLRAAK